MVKLLLGIVAAADPRPYRAAARVHRHKAGLQHRALLPRLAPSVGQGLQLRHLPFHCLVGCFLELGVQRRVHPQSIGLDVIAPGVGPGDQPFAQVLGKMRRGSRRFALPLEVDMQGFLLERLTLRASRIG